MLYFYKKRLVFVSLCRKSALFIPKSLIWEEIIHLPSFPNNIYFDKHNLMRK